MMFTVRSLILGAWAAEAMQIWLHKLFYNILSDCHYFDVINSLLNAFRSKKIWMEPKALYEKNYNGLLFITSNEYIWPNFFCMG